MRWLAVVAVACAHPAPVVSHRDEVLSAGEAIGLPIPPQQHQPWTPGATLPPALAAAVATLFDQGFADPRGLDYREVELAVGDATSTTAIIAKTHAWVFDRHAVAWNGLVYPVVRAGHRADLGADLARLAAARAPETVVWKELDAVAVDTPHLLKVAMLARLGADAAAIAVWGAAEGEPYDVLSRRWVYALSDRAIAAHDRADHVMALASARTAALVQAARAQHGHTESMIGLDLLPRLIADEQHPRSRAPLPERKVLAAMAPAPRVALLIEHLDEIRMSSYDGGITDPVVVPALIAAGPAAVEPLIAVIEADPRLTRATWVNDRDGYMASMGVEIAATEGVSKILDRLFFEKYGVPDPRAELAADMRAYWKKWQGVSDEERWYLQLADDAGDPHDQLMAALFMTQVGGSGLRGDPLRNHAPPTVAELIERRIAGTADVGDACYYASAYYRWEPTAALPSMTKVMRAAITAAGTGGMQAPCISELAKLRDDAGDPGGIADYAHWLEQTTPADHLPLLTFETAAALPTRPAIVHALDVLFRDGSPWLPLLDPTGAHPDETDIFAGPLIEHPALNRQLVAALADTRAFTTLAMIDAHTFEVRLPGGGGLTSPIDDGDRFAPAAGEHLPLRVCDWIAGKLVEFHGDGPRFRVYWPQRKRDDAIAALTRWVQIQATP